jgi:3-dehydroquinate dehydratase-1
MLKLGRLALGRIPRLAISFKDNVSPGLIRKIKNPGSHVAELRIDQYSSFEIQHVLKEAKKFSKFPSIATIRSKKEGGRWYLSDQKRIKLFEAVLPYVDAVDIELSSKAILKDVISKAHRAKKQVIVSYHNFDKTPPVATLTTKLKEAKSCKADIIKIATFALSKQDVQTLAEFTLLHRCQNIITVSMGDEGVISRILFPALGSLITYASSGGALAPGQLHYKVAMDLLRRMYPKYK